MSTAGDDEPTAVGRAPAAGVTGDDPPTDVRHPAGSDPVAARAAGSEPGMPPTSTDPFGGLPTVEPHTPTDAPPNGVPPTIGDAPKNLLDGTPVPTDPKAPKKWQPPTAAKPEEKLSFGGAVIGGVKEAGAPVVGFLDLVGGHLILVAKALAWLPRRPMRLQNYLEAGEYIGFGSLPIVLLVGAFTGMVMSLQSVYAFQQFSLESFAGATTGKALALELGPVLTALMLAGRAGSGIATELGTMRITEQIDALESMAVNPIQYLVLPRLVAATIVAPILALLFFVVGMGGAYFVAVIIKQVDQGAWVSNLRDIVTPLDVIQGMIKSCFFGFLIALIGCYQGYNATGGGRGVGIGTTRAVVIASVTTLVVDYFLTDILFSIMGTAVK